MTQTKSCFNRLLVYCFTSHIASHWLYTIFYCEVILVKYILIYIYMLPSIPILNFMMIFTIVLYTDNGGFKTLQCFKSFLV